MEYGYKRKINNNFEDAIKAVSDSLQEEGFGILTTIDVKATVKKKLDKEFDNYVILGACNPPFAYNALMAEKEIGLMLPCNVIVYEDAEEVYASAVLPTIAMGMVDNPSLRIIAEQIEEKLKKAIDSL